MKLPRQTVALLQAASQLVDSLPADAVLIVTEVDLNWSQVRTTLAGCRQILVATDDRALNQRLKEEDDLIVLDIETDPMPSHERMSWPLLRAIGMGILQPGSDVIVVYNGITDAENLPEAIDSLSIIHLGEHLERMTAQDLRRLETNIPLETLRLVSTLATEVGREGREGKPVGAIIVVGDTRRVLSMSRPINFNPFRGYSRAERDLRDRRVREQIKDIAQMDGAILIGRDGIAIAACLYLDVLGSGDGVIVGRGLGSRHRAAAAISRRTQAIAFCVSQSSGSVRVFQQGEEALHIEPLFRPHIWRKPRLEGEQELEEETLVHGED